MSNNSRQVLELIAGGYTYEQIVNMNQHLEFRDVLAAAKEALDLIDELIDRTSYHKRIEKVKENHPRAYEKWSDDEEQRLKELVSHGKSAKEIAEVLGRQPTAITSRIDKLGLNQ